MCNELFFHLPKGVMPRFQNVASLHAAQARGQGPFQQFQKHREISRDRGKIFRHSLSSRSSTPFRRGRLSLPLSPEQPSFRRRDLCAGPAHAKWELKYGSHLVKSLVISPRLVAATADARKSVPAIRRTWLPFLASF